MTANSRTEKQEWLCLDARSAALTAALYTICSCVLGMFLYGWRIAANSRDPTHLQDVYWGVQIAYVATVSSHLILCIHSCWLIVGIHKERAGAVTQWVVVNISLMALEAVCCCYSNVLRDHVNKKFDVISEAELVFFTTRVFFNVLSLAFVMRFLRNINSGISYRDLESIAL